MRRGILMAALLLSQAAPAPRPITDADAYAVYAAVLPSEWPVRVAHATELVIQEQTTDGGPMMAECFPEVPDTKGAWADALADYKRQNAAPWTLTRSFPLAVPYTIETKEEIDSFFKEVRSAGWVAFNAAHPNSRGYLQMSAVGFDHSRTRAVVYVGHWCGGLCGGGGVHFLQREQGRWTEVHPAARTCEWVS